MSVEAHICRLTNNVWICSDTVLVPGPTMRERNERLSALFYRGNYQDVLAAGLGRAGTLASDEDFSLLVGALSFSGRKEEADAIYSRRREQLAEPWASACRFYLGISYCRHGGYAKARSFFAKNLRASRRKALPLGRGNCRNHEHAELLRFYAMQGLGFYRYFCARFEGARVAAEQSLSSATLARSPNGKRSAHHVYARAIATDLLGHTLVQLGSIQAGLQRLEQAEKLAGQLGDGGLARSIAISHMVYRASFGLEPHKAVAELRRAYRRLDPQNSHAYTNLLLELANQHMLRGQLREASKSLDEASTWIYRSQHRRHGYLLSLRLAELGYRSGQYGSSLHRVREVRGQLDPRHDRLTLIMALGLELKLLKALGINDAGPDLTSGLESLTAITGRSVSRAILARSSGTPSRPDSSRPSSEDAVARVLSRSHRDLREVAQEMISTGYLGVLSDVLDVDRAGRWLVIGVLGNDCAIFDQGTTVYVRDGLPKQIYGLLELISLGEISKPVLVRQLWGYEYHPLRHDPALYQAISRLRACLGEYGDWIEATEEGYRLKPHVKVKNLEPNVSRKTTPDAAQTVPSRLRNVSAVSALNPRQMQILGFLRSQELVGVPDCAKKLRVTEMTLRRDFIVLCRTGLVERTGKARSTRYRLPSQGPCVS